MRRIPHALLFPLLLGNTALAQQVAPVPDAEVPDRPPPAPDAVTSRRELEPATPPSRDELLLQLRRGNRMANTGIAMTVSGFVHLAVGVGLFLGARHECEVQSGDFCGADLGFPAFGLLITGVPMMLVGLPLLFVGQSRRSTAQRLLQGVSYAPTTGGGGMVRLALDF
jgi:hypothetical protein